MDNYVAAYMDVAETLEGLLQSGKAIFITFAGGIYEGSANARKSSSTTLVGCLDGMTDHPRMKTCIRVECAAQGAKRLSAFGPDRDSADGHAAVCKACEAIRINLHSKAKRASRRGDLIPPAGHQDEPREASG